MSLIMEHKLDDKGNIQQCLEPLESTSHEYISPQAIDDLNWVESRIWSFHVFPISNEMCIVSLILIVKSSEFSLLIQ